MTDIITVPLCGGLPRTPTIYRGKLVECTEKRIASRGKDSNKFTVTDVIIKNASGYHRLSVALPAGLILYKCIHTNNRADRMNAITFEFNVIEETQHITGFKMHDAAEWIGDTIDRENQTKDKRINISNQLED